MRTFDAFVADAVKRKVKPSEDAVILDDICHELGALIHQAV